MSYFTETKYGYKQLRAWVVAALCTLFASAFVWFVFVVFTAISAPTPATITFVSGETRHCDDGRWAGGGFGAANKFRCDGVTYTIGVIESVTFDAS